jgi:hypothetical protein
MRVGTARIPPRGSRERWRFPDWAGPNPMPVARRRGSPEVIAVRSIHPLWVGGCSRVIPRARGLSA